MAETYSYAGLPGYEGMADVTNPYAAQVSTDAGAQAANLWWQQLLSQMEGAQHGSWDASGNYTPRYSFVYGDTDPRPREAWSGNYYDPNNHDPVYQADFQYFQRAASGSPGTGWTVEFPDASAGIFGGVNPVLMATGALLGAGAAGGMGAGVGVGTGAAEGAVASAPAWFNNPSLWWAGFQGAQGLGTAAANPSGAGLGGTLGGLAGTALGAYLGLPGGGALGKVGGSFLGGQFDAAGNPVSGTSSGGLGALGGTMAEGGSIDYGQLLASLIGLGGTGLSLFNATGTAGQQQTAYQQQQDQYRMLQQLFAAYNMQLQGYNQEQIGAYLRAVQEQQQREQIGANLSNPAAVMAGTQALYHPLTENMQQNIGRDVYGQLAQHGATQGGGAEAALMQAFAPYESQLWTQALGQYLASQGEALSAYNYGPRPAQPAYAGSQAPQPSTFIPGTTGGGTQNTSMAGAMGSLGPLVGQLARSLGLSPTQTTSLAQMLGIGGTQGLQNPQIGTGLSQDPFAPSNNPYQLSPSELQQSYLADTVGSYGDLSQGFDPTSIPYDYGSFDWSTF